MNLKFLKENNLPYKLPEKGKPSNAQHWYNANVVQVNFEIYKEWVIGLHSK